MPSTEEEQSYGKEVIFSRRYSPDHNDLDIVFTEICFTEELLGIPFMLVPKDKILMLYQASGTIVLPAPVVNKRIISN